MSDEEQQSSSKKALPQGKRLLQQANAAFYSTPIQTAPPSLCLGVAVSDPSRRDGAVAIPEPGSKEFEQAQQDQLQRLFDESLCVLLRRTGAEAMRRRILAAVQHQASEMVHLDESLSSAWEDLTSTIMEADTADSALHVAPAVQAILSRSMLTERDLAGSSYAVDAAGAGAMAAGVAGRGSRSERGTVSVGCNTVNRGDSEKDALIASLKKAKADSDRKVDELRKELASLKKQLSFRAPSTFAASPAPIAGAALHMPQLFSSAPSDSPPEPCILPSLTPTSASHPSVARETGHGRSASTPPLPVVKNISIGSGSSPGSPVSSSQVTSSSSHTAVDASVAVCGASTPTSSLSSLFATQVGGFRRERGAKGNRGGGTLKLLLQRHHQQLKEIRGKLSAIKTGVRAFAFADVFAQFTHLAIPPIHSLTASNLRLMDRNYVLEKTCLDFLSRLGTMPDLNSTEGYLPEGGPLHVGSYSLMEERRFSDWVAKLHGTFMVKAGKVQDLIASLTTDVNRTLEQSYGSRKDMSSLEDRCQALECIIVGDECLMVAAAISDALDGVQVQQTRKPEYATLVKAILDTNGEVRVACAIAGWSSKPAARVKVNMWRQRRAEAMQRLEQMLGQDLQHFASGGAAKAALRSKMLLLRDMTHNLSKLHLMPTVRQATAAADLIGVASPTSPGAAVAVSPHRSNSIAAIAVVASRDVGGSGVRLGDGGGGPPASVVASSLVGLQQHLQRSAADAALGGPFDPETPDVPPSHASHDRTRENTSLFGSSSESMPASVVAHSAVHRGAAASVNGGMAAPAHRRRSTSNVPLPVASRLPPVASREK